VGLLSKPETGLVLAVGLTACSPAPPVARVSGPAVVSYADPATFSVFPSPSIAFQPDGLADAARRKLLTDSLARPLIRASRRPIALVLFEFYPAHPDRVGVHVYWVGGGYHSLLMKREGGRDPDFSAYEPHLRVLEELP
jgi:hypothetical protein